MEVESSTPVSIASLFEAYEIPAPRRRVTERGELLAYFSRKLDRPIPSFTSRLTGLKLPDLYYIKSDCDQAEARGVPWGAAFWSSLKTR